MRGAQWLECYALSSEFDALDWFICAQHSRLTPQFSGRVMTCDVRRERIMQWRARAVAATTYLGPLQLLGDTCETS